MTAKKTELNEPVLATLPEQDWREERKKDIQEAQERMTKMRHDLSEQFPKEVERQLKKGGTSLTYIPVSEVINRLNKVLGIDGWSYEIIKCERDALDPDFIVAHVRMTVYPGVDKFVSAVKDGFGGQKIKRTKNGDIVDLGDEFKGAVSDALKKAAQSLGVGLYLARSEEAMGIEQEESIDPVIETMWTQFVDLSKGLSADGKKSLNDFWVSYAGTRPKPTKNTATKEDLDALTGECIRISMEAE
jgi:hypothetical protein